MKTDSAAVYNGVAEELAKRILALIPDNPQLLEMTDCWELFKVPGFNCKDLGPTMFQAGWALNKAKHDYKASQEK